MSSNHKPFRAPPQRTGSPILVSHRGLDILRFTPTDKPVVPADDRHIPLTWVITVPRYRDGYVLAYNHNREQWELPGGGIEPGETPSEAAVRELMEEASQVADGVSCRGVMKIRLVGSGKFECAALYYVELEALSPFAPNRETSELTICNPARDTRQILTPFSRWMIRTASGRETD
jgi:8-oxo-dGTP pyrophosphatase MutT (NUDIX family)